MGATAGDGLDFLRLPVVQERAVAEGKLDVITAEHLDADFAALGGQPILDHLTKTHTDYVAAIEAAKVAPPELVLVREKLDALLDSLQIYLVRVMGTVQRGQPDTQKRADELLRPLLEWDRSNKPAAPATPPAAPATPPAAPATPPAAAATPPAGGGSAPDAGKG